MRAFAAPRWQALAIAVIYQAILDSDETRVMKHKTKPCSKEAIRFLNNSPELDFYASLAGCESEMVKAGYLKRQ